MKKRTLAHLALSLAAILALPLAHAQAPAFPSKPASIVVPYAPGGPVDNLSRVLATRLGKEWGQSVLVVNKTGANEIIGAEPVGSTPEEMAQHLARESERWTKLIQERGIKLD